MARVEVRILTPDEREALDLAREKSIRRLSEHLFGTAAVRDGLDRYAVARLQYAQYVQARMSVPFHPAILRALGIDLTV